MNSRAKLICLDAKTGEPVDGVRRARRRRSDEGPALAGRSEALHEHVAAGRLQESRDSRQWRRRPADVPAGSARRRARVRREDRAAGVELPHGARPGEPGVDTWGDGVVEVHGPHERVGADEPRRSRAGSCICRSARRATTSTARDGPGENLYGDSIVCLDAATGKLKWYFQVAHHGLWDYDPASAPAIVSMKVDGRAIDGVVQLTKQGFVFVFDRVTGKPVWPIEERPVPASDVDGRARVADAAVPDEARADLAARHDARRRVRSDAGARRPRRRPS